MVVAVGDFFARHRANWDDPSHDRAGNRLWREDSVADANSIDKDELYTYDGSYRLTELQRGDVTTGASPSIGDRNFRELWALDATGNWEIYSRDKDGDATLGDLGSGDELHGRCHNKANEITSINRYLGQTGLAWSAPAHDRAGNMTIIPQPAAPSDHFHLEYDAWNRLVTVKAADDSTLVAAYEYDGLNRRTLKEVYASGSLAEVRHFYYSSQWQCLEERTETGSGSSSSSSSAPGESNVDTQYVWGLRYVDDLVLRDRDTSDPQNGTLNERLYALQDPNWNVIALANSDGDIIQRFTYDAYGKATPLNPNFTTYSGTDYGWDYLYTGRRLDVESGLMYYRNRYYDTGLGKFINRDPIEYRSGDENLYRYVGNKPLEHRDPTGTAAIMETICDVTTGIPFMKKGPDFGKVGPCRVAVTVLHEMVHMVEILPACQKAKAEYDRRVQDGRQLPELFVDILFANWVHENRHLLECHAYTVGYYAAKAAAAVACAVSSAIGFSFPCLSTCCSDLQESKENSKVFMDFHCLLAEDKLTEIVFGPRPKPIDNPHGPVGPIRPIDY